MKNLEIRYLAENENDKWDDFVDISPQGNIFNKTYWLNCVSDNYKILIALENGRIVGGIALTQMYNGFYRTPKLTPQLGILLEKPDKNIKNDKIISREIEISEALIKGLPKYKQFNYAFSHNYKNLLPFIWNDFETSVRYTYVIDDTSDMDKVFANFAYDEKYEIKKAIKNKIKVVDNFGIDEFYKINKKTFDRQKMEMPYSLELLKKIDSTLETMNRKKMLYAINENNDILAGIYLIYDNNYVYYLMSGADPDYRNMGLQSLLIFEGIKFASSLKLKFDFEGSVIRNIERSFRSFGGDQKIIYNIYKSDAMTNFIYKFAVKHKNVVKKVFKV